jgi:CelD/BcsL family acetyltransferase involved in cellulose biosynthesis
MTARQLWPREERTAAEITGGPTVVVTSRLGGWAAQWDRLVDRSPLPSPFLRSWWLAVASGPASRFLLVTRDDQLLGGLAVQADRRLGLRCLHMLGSGILCPDHLDLLAASGHEETVASLLRSTLSRLRVALVDLQGVRAEPMLMAALPWRLRQQVQDVAPWARLPRDLADYPALLRRNVRRASGKLTSQGAEHRAHRGAAVTGALATLRVLHQAQWGADSRFLPGFGRFAAACDLGAAAGEVVVHELHVADTVIASLVAFEVASRVSLYQSARLTDPRWRDATTVLLHTIIANARERGLSEVDFLRGNEGYKAGFAPERRELVRLQGAVSWPAKAATAAEMAARGVQRATRH